MKKICHIMWLDKFIPPYINFIETYLNPKQHTFLIYGDEKYLAQYPLPKRDNIVLLWERFPNVFLRDLYLAWHIQIADKVFIHGLWEHRANRVLSFVFWNLKKCHYAIWGGDLFDYINGDKNDPWYHKREKYRRFIIKRFGFFIPVVYGDYELACKWYGAKGKMLEPFMYVGFYEEYKDIPFKQRGENLIIQVGNSATPTNNHEATLNLLKQLSNDNLQIYAPLSYGDMKYAMRIKKIGKDLFGDKFHALESFMPFSEYQKFLQSIDIAIFNHKEQQAMGNIFVLLALGKKVYLNTGTTHYDFLIQKGFKIFSIKDFNLDHISFEDSMHNRELLLKLYSKENQISNQKSFYS